MSSHERDSAGSHEQPRPRLQKSKASASTIAIQPLEITTTAVVTGNTDSFAGSSNEGHEQSETNEKGHTIISSSSTSENTSSIGEDVWSEADNNVDLRRKPSHHHHHHHHHHYHIVSPVFHADSSSSVSPLGSPLSSAGGIVLTPSSNEAVIFPELPPPIIKGPSEAIVALQDAANG